MNSATRLGAIISFFIVFLLGGLIAMLALALRLNSIADDNQDNIAAARMNTEQIKAVGDLLIECVVAPAERGATSDPAHPDCYTRAKAQTAAAVNSIVDVDKDGCPDHLESRAVLDALVGVPFDLSVYCPNFAKP